LTAGTGIAAAGGNAYPSVVTTPTGATPTIEDTTLLSANTASVRTALKAGENSTSDFAFSVVFPVGTPDLDDAVNTPYRPTFILSGFFFGNSGADYRVRNEVYYESKVISATNMNNAGSGAWSTAPGPNSGNAASANDSSVTIIADLVHSDSTDTAGDVLLFKFPSGTQFATSTFAVDTVSGYFAATSAI
jgi:hypothetical protein